jgi:hypothetical protein
MRAQATDEERRAVATHLIDNGTSHQALEDQVDALWSELQSRHDAIDCFGDILGQHRLVPTPRGERNLQSLYLEDVLVPAMDSVPVRPAARTRYEPRGAAPAPERFGMVDAYSGQIAYVDEILGRLPAVDPLTRGILSEHKADLIHNWNTDYEAEEKLREEALHWIRRQLPSPDSRSNQRLR